MDRNEVARVSREAGERVQIAYVLTAVNDWLERDGGVVVSLDPDWDGGAVVSLDPGTSLEALLEAADWKRIQEECRELVERHLEVIAVRYMRVLQPPVPLVPALPAIDETPAPI